MASAVFSVNDLCWQANDQLILDHLTFSVAPNTFVGIIGPNGAGKSSLLRCLYRKITDCTGQIQFNDRPLSEYSRRELAQQIAVVLQEPPSQFELTVRDVIGMGLTPHKALLSFDDHHDHANIENAAKEVDLLHKLDQNFNSLSGGEKQRAMIARAIVQKPKVLIMDEPTNHLDIRHQLEVLTLAKKLNITVIVSIHDLNLAATYCDQFILMDRGKIISMGSHEKVLSEDYLSCVFGVHATIDDHPMHQGQRITFNLKEPIPYKDINDEDASS